MNTTKDSTQIRHKGTKKQQNAETKNKVKRISDAMPHDISPYHNAFKDAKKEVGYMS